MTKEVLKKIVHYAYSAGYCCGFKTANPEWDSSIDIDEEDFNATMRELSVIHGKEIDELHNLPRPQ